ELAHRHGGGRTLDGARAHLCRNGPEMNMRAVPLRKSAGVNARRRYIRNHHEGRATNGAVDAARSLAGTVTAGTAQTEVADLSPESSRPSMAQPGGQLADSGGEGRGDASTVVSQGAGSRTASGGSGFDVSGLRSRSVPSSTGRSATMSRP